jgi:hypothetical protein
MRVAIDDESENECNQVTVTCTITSSGWIPVEGMSQEDTFAGDQLILIIDQVRENIVADNTVTFKLKKLDGTEIAREINLTKLFDLVRDHTDEDGLPSDEDQEEDEEDRDN